MAYALIAVVLVGGWLFCLLDVLTSDERQVRLLPKPVWLLIALLGFVLGSVLWLLAGRPRGRRLESVLLPPGAGFDRHPDAPKGPDDDPAFLHALSRRIHGDD
ncbi:PLD nuclease N-terminal domain-containing protein [Actinomadura harenae]|uniref:PLDc_N domain-containing protein n=1 Tax=Actinomadura harenae TaxID=2483351 RepID=A0A3M2MDN0_9ACTN|nr:PLD nuclease N-terminal domain-containing protein [Actinomadura harenae]RMI47667.1 PLDc_N domain-containing protein [Actinomadura harenae]